MGLFDWIKGRRASGGSDDGAGAGGGAPSPVLPWDRKPSIYEHIRAHVEPGRPGLTSGGEVLPDEERVAAFGGIRWAPGAEDGVFTHHFGGEADEAAAAQLADAILAYCAAPTVAQKLAAYEAVPAKGLVGLIDPVLEKLRGAQGLDHRRLHELAWSLATEASDRGPVKLGIAILGLFRGEGLAELLHTLGRHDELTLYCVVALLNVSEAPERDLWELARNVEGWGRVQTVERLAPMASDERVKYWLLREGYRNTVMNEYLAHVCATGGGLLAALRADDVDDGLLDAAGEIFQALVAGGPAPGIDQYDDADAAVEAYLGHLAARASKLSQLNAVATIRGWLAGREDGKATGGLLSRCDEILADPAWRERVAGGLASDDGATFDEASRAAKALGIDDYAAHLRRLKAAPGESGRWCGAMSAAGRARAHEVIALAEMLIPLERIATGPAQETGLGRAFEAHSCLDFVLQQLGQHPGRGLPLIRAGLSSPVVRNRNFAVRALAAWGRERWPAGAEAMLTEALAREPDDELRESIRKALAGEEVE